MLILKTAYLANFIGLLKGTKTNSITLKFNAAGVINFQGLNGSGKTSTLRLLHPYSDSKDELIEDDDVSTPEKVRYLTAEKILTYVDTKTEKEVVIKNIYSKTGTKKCYISVNGEELNPNGNTTSYNTLVEETFKFKDDLISNRIITTVKSNNFLELSPMQRKTEISSLLPDIKVYIDYFKAVNDNLKTLNNELTFITSEIQKLSDINSLKEVLIAQTGNLETNKKNQELLLARYTAANSSKDVINEKFHSIVEKHKVDGNNFDISMRSTINNLMTEITALEAVVYPSDYVDTIKQKLEVISRELMKTRLDTDNINISIVENNNIYHTLNNNFKQEIDCRKELTSSLNQLEDLKVEYSKLLNVTDDIESKIQNITLPLDFDSNVYSSKLNMIHKNLGILNSEPKIEQVMSEYSKTSSKLATTLQQISALDSDLSNARGQVSAFSSLSAMASNMGEKLSALIGENSCDLSACKETLESSIGKLLADIDIMNNTYTTLTNYVEDSKPLLDLTKNMRDSLTAFSYNPITFEKDIDTFLRTEMVNLTDALNLSKELGAAEAARQKHSFESSHLFTQINALTARTEQLSKNLETLTVLGDSETMAVKIEECKRSYEHMSEIIRTNNVKLKELDTKEKVLRGDLEKFYNSGNSVLLRNKLQEIESDFDLGNKLIADYNVAVTKLNEEVTNYNAVFATVKSLEKSVTETTMSIELLTRQQINLQAISDKIEKFSKIREALHISSGLPSIISNKILDVIQQDCNSMIKEMFNAQFTINFVNTEKELSIIVYNSYNGKLCEYSFLSGGEQSIIKIVLSLALLKFKVGENVAGVLRLDEIDSFMDTDNIQSFDQFLDLLMVDKGIEQLFLISHNVNLDGQKIYFDKHNKCITTSSRSK